MNLQSIRVRLAAGDALLVFATFTATGIFSGLAIQDRLSDTRVPVEERRDTLNEFAWAMLIASPAVLTMHVDGAVATVDVRDAGVGIAAADVPRIFERFYRVRRGSIASDWRHRTEPGDRAVDRGVPWRPDCRREHGRRRIGVSRRVANRCRQ